MAGFTRDSKSELIASVHIDVPVPLQSQEKLHNGNMPKFACHMKGVATISVYIHSVLPSNGQLSLHTGHVSRSHCLDELTIHLPQVSVILMALHAKWLCLLGLQCHSAIFRSSSHISSTI